MDAIPKISIFTQNMLRCRRQRFFMQGSSRYGHQIWLSHERKTKRKYLMGKQHKSRYLWKNSTRVDICGKQAFRFIRDERFSAPNKSCLEWFQFFMGALKCSKRPCAERKCKNRPTLPVVEEYHSLTFGNSWSNTELTLFFRQSINFDNFFEKLNFY